MIPISNEKIEQIRKLSEQQIQLLYGDHIKLFIQQYKAGEYIKYAISGPLSEEALDKCRRIITESGTIIGKVFFDE